MMRIALLLSCDAFEDFFGKTFGLDRDRYLQHYRNDFAWDYAAGLRDRQIEAVLYIPSFRYSGIYSTPDGFQVRFLPLASWYRFAQPLFAKFKRLAIVTYLSELINTTALIDSLVQGLEADQVALLYIQEYWTHRFDLLVDRLSLPIIGAGHGATDQFASLARKRQTFPKAHKLICQSQAELQTVMHYGGDAVLIPNAVDTDFYSPDATTPRIEKRILTVARLEDRQKRLSDLLRALTHLDSAWTLDIVGSGPDLDRLQQLAASLGVSDRVQFSGFITDKQQLRQKYRQCRVFALPSAWEAVALALLEAMSCGCAVVASDIDTFRAVVRDALTGVRVPVNAPDQLAQAILQADANRDRLGEQARSLVVNSYSKPQLFSQLAAVIRDCTPNHSSVAHSVCSVEGS